MYILIIITFLYILQDLSRIFQLEVDYPSLLVLYTPISPPITRLCSVHKNWLPRAGCPAKKTRSPKAYVRTSMSDTVCRSDNANYLSRRKGYIRLVLK